MDHKFKIGDIVRHAATTNGVKMVVIGVGVITTEAGPMKVYQLSGERTIIDGGGGVFTSILSEKELVAAI